MMCGTVFTEHKAEISDSIVIFPLFISVSEHLEKFCRSTHPAAKSSETKRIIYRPLNLTDDNDGANEQEPRDIIPTSRTKAM
jgi:hypothetical protein